MAHSPHRRRKGCGLCKPHKLRGYGRSVRDPWPVARKLGRKRRFGRRDVGDQD
ncbi:hypothetical protein ACWDR0_03550 [Streptomyces sp. NPDC003691]